MCEVYDAFEDFIQLKEDFEVVMESLELMENEEFMVSYRKAKKELNNRDFVDWDEL